MKPGNMRTQNEAWEGGLGETLGLKDWEWVWGGELITQNIFVPSTQTSTAVWKRCEMGSE